jgi:hypothetical protein
MNDIEEKRMNSSYVAPRLAVADGPAVVDSEWAMAGAVAAFLGLGTALVYHVCGNVCVRRSFWDCVNAVRDYFYNGCTP